jgi:hypothetical protein
MGHSVDANQNVYIQTGLESRPNAVDGLESFLGGPDPVFGAVVEQAIS